MSSIGRGFSQVTSNFVVKTIDGYGDMFLPVDFNTWYSNNSAALTKVSDSIYLVNDETNFATIAKNLGHVLGSNYLQQFNAHTAKDMGVEISIGIASDPRLLVFRRAKMPSVDTNFGSGQAGYVVTENNVSNLTRPRFEVAVARS